MKIKKVRARQILDSRGNPTVECDVYTEHFMGRAAVPSGASTGKYEAVELRDNKKNVYQGKGVLNAIANIHKKIAPKIDNVMLDPVDAVSTVDQMMLSLDGTESKKKLGANAMLAVSMATARVAALEQNKPVYATLMGEQKKYTLPVPFANIINGGKHADNGLFFQEFMIVPKAKTFSLATEMVAETFHILKDKIKNKYGHASANYGDEGGFAPNIESMYQALDLLTDAIGEAGYRGKMKIAIDAAASEFFTKDGYQIGQFNKIAATKLLDYYKNITKAYPILSIEDPFDQDDFESFAQLTKMSHIQIVGDDLLVTNRKRITLAIENQLCNALLLKVNQIGTVTEALAAGKLALENNWKVMVSHRSGETEDPFIADLAVALGSGQIKLGAPNRSDRTAKYNELLRIEEELGKQGKLAQLW